MKVEAMEKKQEKQEEKDKSWNKKWGTQNHLQRKESKKTRGIKKNNTKTRKEAGEDGADGEGWDGEKQEK